jgi:protocatechuate 3,4-dioxygenase beta subunit
MRRYAAAFVLLLCALAPLGRAQPGGVIAGRVVAADTGDPLRNALVTVTTPRDLPPVLTDANGLFSIAAPSEGGTVSVAKAGYAKTTVTLQAPAEAVVLKLFRGAVLSGAVMDDKGDPVIGVSVIVEAVPVKGQSAAVLAAPLTDDLGEYRASGLEAGQVTVSIFASPTSIRMISGSRGVTIQVGGPGDPAQRVYFPGVLNVGQAATLSLQPGDDKTGVDFTVGTVALLFNRGAVVREERQEPERSAAVISGRVLRPGGRPLAGAIVRLIPALSTLAPPKLAFTDGQGAYRFVIPEAAAGSYRVAANGPGYLGTEYGQRRASDPGEEITVAAGDTRDRVDLTLQRPGTIAGRLFDENGEPVEGVAVQAAQVRYVDGRRRLVESAPRTRPTDDQGRYRIFGLQPGEYFVSAAVGQVETFQPLAELPGYGTTYFPGTPNPAEAQRVTVGRSQDVAGIDFAIARVKTARLSGRAIDSKGDPITGGIALMASRRSGTVATRQMGARIEPDGRFEFPNLAPGEYVLQASRHRSSGWNEGESFSQFVTITGVDVSDVQIRTSTGSTVSGHVTLEGGGTFSPGQIQLSAAPVDPDLSPMIGGGAARAVPDEDLEFQFAGLSGPRRLTVNRVPPGWTLQAILLNGIDVTDTPLPFGKADQSLSDVDVVLSHHVTRLTGQVNARGRPSAGSSILLFSADRQAWYPQSRFFKRAISASDGAFSVEGLPPGEYLAAALDAVPGGRDGDDWQDPDYLETLMARARRITLSEGAHLSLTLTVQAR